MVTSLCLFGLISCLRGRGESAGSYFGVDDFVENLEILERERLLDGRSLGPQKRGVGGSERCNGVHSGYGQGEMVHSGVNSGVRRGSLKWEPPTGESIKIK